MENESSGAPGHADHYVAMAPEEPAVTVEEANLLKCLQDAGFSEQQMDALIRLFWFKYMEAEDNLLPAALRTEFSHARNESQKPGSPAHVLRDAAETIADKRIERFVERVLVVNEGDLEVPPGDALANWIRQTISDRFSDYAKGAREILEGDAVDGFIEEGSPVNETLRMLEAAVHRYKKETVRTRTWRLTERLMKRAEALAVRIARIRGDSPDRLASIGDERKYARMFRRQIEDVTRCFPGPGTNRKWHYDKKVIRRFDWMVAKYSDIPKKEWDRSSLAPSVNSEARQAHRDLRKEVKKLARAFCKLQDTNPSLIPIPEW